MTGATRNHVLVVGHGDAVGARVRSRRPAARVSLLAGVGAPVGEKTRGDYDLVEVVDHHQPELAVRAARAIHAGSPVTHVVQVGEHALTSASLIARDLGLPGHDPRTVESVVDKLRMRRVLASAGLDPTTTWCPPGDLPTVSKVGAVVVKPRGSSGSRGVRVVRTQDDLDAAVGQALLHATEVGGCLVESFHAGPLYSVDCFSENGSHILIFTSQEFIDPVTCVERGYVMPAPLPPAREAVLVECALRALDALGVRDGATHTELVWTASGPRIIETHLRVAADLYAELVLDMLGIDLVDAIVLQQLGEQVGPGIRESVRWRRPRSGAAAVWFSSPNAHGRVVKVLRPAVTPAEVVIDACRLDEDYGGDTDNLARVARVMARASDPATALTTARAVARDLRFVLVVGPAAEPAEPHPSGFRP